MLFEAQREERRAERRRRYRRGWISEHLGAAFLMAKGYRVLARRQKTPAGEIDLIAVRRRRLVFVEVKRRASLAEAEASVGPRQRARIRRAADLWLARHPRYMAHEIGFDLIFLVPRRWPVHLENAL
jgi:putative endonuclease